MDNNNQQNNTTDELLSNIELSSIYKKISVESSSDFDEKEELDFLIKCIDNCYDTEFKRIDTKELINDINKLNQKLAILIHYCNNNYKYRNVSKIFLAYCDYFDLEYNKCYVNLHDKLQTLIKHGFVKLIGGMTNYKKLKNKLDPDNIKTLWDLIK